MHTARARCAWFAAFFVLACERLVNVCFAVEGRARVRRFGRARATRGKFSSGASRRSPWRRVTRRCGTSLTRRRCWVNPRHGAGDDRGISVLGGRTLVSRQPDPRCAIGIEVTIFNLERTQKRRAVTTARVRIDAHRRIARHGRRHGWFARSREARLRRFNPKKTPPSGVN